MTPGDRPSKPRSGGAASVSRSDAALHRASVPARTPAAAERRRHPALLGAMVTSIVCVGVLFVGPFPVRTWWSQHNRATALQKQIKVLNSANGKLRTKAAELNDPATIEGLARSEHGMVPKGSSAYAILPPPVPANSLPAVWPFVQLDQTGTAGATP